MNNEQVKDFLFDCLIQEAGNDSIQWLMEQKEKIATGSSAIKFYMAFSQSSRYFKKNLLQITASKLKEADRLVPGFRPDSWDQLQTARAYLLLHYPASTSEEWMTMLTKLTETGDMHEQQSLYAALPVMPFQEKMVDKAIDGLRTNITSIFDAIALNNPFPAAYFPEAAWNQMVIKAIFLQRPLYQIRNSDQRANENLANILIDFAHERWAAGRSVMPELWRFVGAYLTENNISDIERVLQTGSLHEKRAMLLACTQSGVNAIQKIIDKYPEIRNSTNLNWKTIGKEYEAMQN